MNDQSTKKIAGAAIKRSRTGLLLQGTIEIDHDLNINMQAFENNFIEYLSLVISEPVEYVKWPENFFHERDKICEQYSDLEWKKIGCATKNYTSMSLLIRYALYGERGRRAVYPK